MKHILVTGATGCIGSNLIVELLHQGYSVRAFRRESSSTLTLNNVDVEHFIGDTRDKESLRRAAKGCDAVMHTAAIVSFWKKRREEQLAINVGGTRNVVEVCIELGIQKLIHTSSVAALGYRSDGQLIDETTAYNWGSDNTYKYSKHLAEQEVLKGAALGLNAIIVNPSVVIGPRDIYIHGGQIVCDIKRGKIPVYVDGGMNIVGVQDVVKGHIAAMKSGKTGERYILGGNNLSHKAIFDLTADLLGGKAPVIKVPVPIAKTIGSTFDIIGLFTSTEPWVTSDLLDGIGRFQWYSIKKAELDLQYVPSPIETAITKAYEWYALNNLL